MQPELWCDSKSDDSLAPEPEMELVAESYVSEREPGESSVPGHTAVDNEIADVNSSEVPETPSSYERVTLQSAHKAVESFNQVFRREHRKFVQPSELSEGSVDYAKELSRSINTVKSLEQRLMACNELVDDAINSSSDLNHFLSNFYFNEAFHTSSVTEPDFDRSRNVAYSTPCGKGTNPRFPNEFSSIVDSNDQSSRFSIEGFNNIPDDVANDLHSGTGDRIDAGSFVGFPQVNNDSRSKNPAQIIKDIRQILANIREVSRGVVSSQTSVINSSSSGNIDKSAAKESPIVEEVEDIVNELPILTTCVYNLRSRMVMVSSKKDKANKRCEK